AALLAVAAVLSLAVGAMLRRSPAAVTAVVVAIVLPYALAVASVLAAEVSQWLLRLTPAAAFAILQSLSRYPQVTGAYTPSGATSHSHRGSASPCCAATPRSPLAWPSTCCAEGTHEAGTARANDEHARSAARGVDQTAHRTGHDLAAAWHHRTEHGGECRRSRRRQLPIRGLQPAPRQDQPHRDRPW